MNGEIRSLFLPCLRGQMGDWTYYSTLMQLRDVGARIQLAQEIHKSDTLCDLIQRSLSNRTEDIAQYLLKQNQRFFNAIIAGIYAGDPQWYEVDLKDAYTTNGLELPENLDQMLGALRLTGDEKIFALDGQHRVAGIKNALSRKPALGYEQLAVIFVAHNNDHNGLQRSRRLFATLNRYAKPVSKLEIIALDEDDPVAIATRELLRDHPLLSKKNVIATSKSKNMPATNTQSFTTAVTLYEGLLSYVVQTQDYKGKQIKDFLAQRPNDKELKKLLALTKRIIDYTVAAFPVFYEYKINAGGDNSAKPFRNSSGGHILFRPVGFLMFMNAVGRAVSKGKDLKHVIDLIARKCNSNYNDFPWNSLLFDSKTETMKSRSERGALKVYSTLLLFHVGLGKIVTDAEHSDARKFLEKQFVGVHEDIPYSYEQFLTI